MNRRLSFVVCILGFVSWVLGTCGFEGGIGRGVGSEEACFLGGPMERDNDAGMSSDGIMYGGDASFGAPVQSAVSTLNV